MSDAPDAPDVELPVPAELPLTDREELILEMLFDARLTCPYLLKQVLGPTGIEGDYGPDTCVAGCSDEPVCTTGPVATIEHPVLLRAYVERYRMMEAE